MSGERIDPRTQFFEERLLYLRSIYTYNWAKQFIGPGMRCLDLGCGFGYGVGVLAEGARFVIGVDLDFEALSYAKGRGVGNCHFVKCKAEVLPFRDETFDVILSFHLIEHIKDDLRFLLEVRRVLRGYGILILSTPNKEMRLLKGGKPWNMSHFREYTAEELRELLGGIFREVKILGLTATGEVLRIEKKRIKRNRIIASIDFLNLRRIIPKFALHPVIHGFHLLGMKKGLDINATDPSALYYVEGDVNEDSLDIIGICRR